jgi:hypothetical protein
MKKHFKAPWSTKLKLISGGLLAFFIYLAGFNDDTIGSIIIFIVLFVAAAFVVRGYSILDGRLLILRMGWSNKFDLSKLKSVEFSPRATTGSVRTFGIGGLFGFNGYYHNSILGNYRSYATNKEHTVVLDFDGKKIVVTPDNPKEFVKAVQQAK